MCKASYLRLDLIIVLIKEDGVFSLFQKKGIMRGQKAKKYYWLQHLSLSTWDWKSSY